MTMPNVMEMIAQLGPGTGPGPGSVLGPSPYPPHPSQHPSGNGGDYPGIGKENPPGPDCVDKLPDSRLICCKSEQFGSL